MHTLTRKWQRLYLYIKGKIHVQERVKLVCILIHMCVYPQTDDSTLRVKLLVIQYSRST